MPPAPPQPGPNGVKTSKAVGVALVGFVILCAIGIAGFLVVKDFDDGHSGGGESPPPPEVIAEDFVHIVDHGFTVNLDGSNLVYGLVAQNPSDQVAYSIRFNLDFVDGTGNVVATGESGLGYLLPGERGGIGLRTDIEGGIPNDVNIAISVSETRSVEEFSAARAGQPTRDDLVMGPPVPVDSSSTQNVYEFTVTNSYPEVLSGGKENVFYDAQGNVIGGSGPYGFYNLEPDETVTENIVIWVDDYPALDGGSAESFLYPRGR